MDMAQQERLSRLTRLLDGCGSGCISTARLQHALEVSHSTVKRDLQFLRDRCRAPVVYDRERGGWRLDRSQPGMGAQIELPGLWLSAEEIHALLTMQHLLATLDKGGVLGPYIEPWMKRLAQQLDGGVPAGTEVARRIRVQTVGARQVHLPHFQSLGSALLRRHRVVIAYHGRSRNSATEREVSPQRLVHYRDNWYLDAWCHWRNALRSFAVDAITAVSVLDRAAIDVPEDELDAVLGSGYGIFAGHRVHWATLRFSAERARWVAAETWHAEQRGEFDGEGRYVLSLPYTEPTELVMDILRHLPEVEVLGPPELDREVRARVRTAMEKWRAG
jgi:predicted DNA-binding transcriptional regulator YafY